MLSGVVGYVKLKIVFAVCKKERKVGKQYFYIQICKMLKRII